MALNLSGKYWQISELEKKLGVPAQKIYPILNSMNGVIRVGYSYLMPDNLMPYLKKQLEKKKYYSITTVARLIGSNPETVKLFIANGLPCVIIGIDEPRIEKGMIEILKKALDEARDSNIEKDKTGMAMKVVRLVELYMKQKRSM